MSAVPSNCVSRRELQRLASRAADLMTNLTGVIADGLRGLLTAALRLDADLSDLGQDPVLSQRHSKTFESSDEWTHEWLGTIHYGEDGAQAFSYEQQIARRAADNAVAANGRLRLRVGDREIVSCDPGELRMFAERCIQDHPQAEVLRDVVEKIFDKD